MVAWSTLRANFSLEAVITNSFVSLARVCFNSILPKTADLDSTETASGEKLALSIDSSRSKNEALGMSAGPVVEACSWLL